MQAPRQIDHLGIAVASIDDAAVFYRDVMGLACEGTEVVEDQGVNYTDTLFDLLKDQFSEREVPLNLNMGIGLAVSKMIMDAHGGKLIFQKSEQEGGQLKMVFQHE